MGGNIETAREWYQEPLEILLQEVLGTKVLLLRVGSPKYEVYLLFVNDMVLIPANHFTTSNVFYGVLLYQ
ncbi:hypothetical protein ABHI18_001574 [Aspergillus niger]